MTCKSASFGKKINVVQTEGAYHASQQPITIASDADPPKFLSDNELVEVIELSR